MLGLPKLVDTVMGVVDKFIPDPKLKQEFKLALIEQEQSLVKSVNETMQAEAKSEHWAQWLWRPVIGFTFAGTIINNYILLPYFATFGLHAVAIPGEVWSAMLVVLGVSAGTRGWEKIRKSKK